MVKLNFPINMENIKRDKFIYASQETQVCPKNVRLFPTEKIIGVGKLKIFQDKIDMSSSYKFDI